ncbi:Polysulphide reductase NrfD [Ferroglobus placidus DSM 10642]|uniref:Polysulphide reductase NrfD n=1 Tax=Ferroglobus placidus (strain DSM 10642 / AEDII12DO) TaxID=589924 RepID=D3S0D7_FERPA|nr:NrfD/PsrC family molybdoenzyme membrane anchor subunit [Ferroglobus placidus]ADC66200.1 Polysulphide reductase NrfD [Ferroglobus placidus DSM 10642]
MKGILREIRYFLDFVLASIKIALTGDRRYYVWLASLVMLVVLGTYAYVYQLMHGLIVTGMRDQVSWGLYISNFTFFVGVAASAVLIVAPLYLYNYREFEYIVTFGEFLAVAALIIALTNVLADVGRVERLWHMFPLIGTPNWPDSMLVWDVIVLNGYLLLNLLIPGYKLYKKYIGSEPSNWIKFFIFLSIPWAALST